jgi:hypothetical protein
MSQRQPTSVELFAPVAQTVDSVCVPTTPPFAHPTPPPARPGCVRGLRQCEQHTYVEKASRPRQEIQVIGPPDTSEAHELTAA